MRTRISRCIKVWCLTGLREQESEDEEESAIPRREFIKMLEYFDLDEGGAFSRSLADLIISTHIPLVVDAFSLLVRTHRSEVKESIFENDEIILQGFLSLDVNLGFFSPPHGAHIRVPSLQSFVSTFF